MSDDSVFEKAKNHSLDNEVEILNSDNCGCYFCRSIFSAREITDWDYEDGHTQALCPKCGMASVIGDASGFPIEKEFLKEMNLRYYGPDYIRSHPEAATVYLDRYFGGKVTHNAKNEKLAISYLKTLVDAKDARAAIALGALYESGGLFSKPDLAKAEAVYSLPFLKGNSKALARLGSLYLNGYVGKLSRWQAFEAIMKSAVANNFEGIFYLANCYFDGFYVDADPEYAFGLLYDVFPEVYDKFLLNRQDSVDFVDFTYGIGGCLHEGLGTQKDDDRALRYFLMAELAIRSKANNSGEIDPIGDKIREKISDIAIPLGLHKSEMVFDQDTFYDSFSEGNQSNERKRLVKAVYDSQTQVCEMTIAFDKPVIMVDEGSLTAEVVHGETNWRFTGVVRYEGPESGEFTGVISPSEGIWIFIDEEKEGPVAFMFFDAPYNEGEAE